ncbi:16S rRNA (uracil(1498)-N(3))-methyltransferase [Planctomonas deserti]|uniref:16S rRNA (uracil(1498)-N(3))-methyltransferase n=1 Tax=Planctomonas deserti TaxID=2144185 RepID=UPI000D33D902|nr:16S rRNA (uracil(1498)-N(3))-methyltransferase [Planctomonas deserti]
MAHFYLAEGGGADWTVGAWVSLVGAEAKHAVTVSRVRVGETLELGDGAGTLARGIVTRADAAELVLQVESVERVPPRSPRIQLAQALAKGDRDELAVQAATELGVDGVLPWSAARSISRWQGHKVAKGRERWAAIVREAAKQSIRPWLPTVGELMTTRQLAELAGSTRMLLLEPTATSAISDLRLADADGAGRNAEADPDRDIVLVVGPEGGIAPEELETLTRAGATAVRLGPEVLRTSTAGPAAIAVLNVALARW